MEKTGLVEMSHFFKSRGFSGFFYIVVPLSPAVIECLIYIKKTIKNKVK